MRKRTRLVRQTELSVRIQKLTGEVEGLVPELKPLLEDDDVHRYLLVSAARSLERAASAVRKLVDRGKRDRLEGDLSSMLEGTVPLMSMLGSRIVLAGGGGAAAPRSPSAGAQALAVLLEDPSRAFAAGAIAKRLGWSVPIARTTLNRLVQSGHARRIAPGRFRAKAR